MDKSMADAIYLFNSGKSEYAQDLLGAHLHKDGGFIFRVWAPNARQISVVGDFNNWQQNQANMTLIKDTGIWEYWAREAKAGQCYKYCITSATNEVVLKTDPFSFSIQKRPNNASILVEPSSFNWNDKNFLEQRPNARANNFPLNIYEIHLASWRTKEDGTFYTYREIAPLLADYLVEMAYTHVELMPIMEHPLDASWGYQVSGYFAPTSRFGSIDDFKYLVNHLHSKGIGVILDWVPAHFPKDQFGLRFFDGQACFEHFDPRLAEQKEWGTMLFDWGKTQVQSFLISSAVYWLEQFHIDGLRFDAVSTMLYHNYAESTYLPNIYGGREHLEGIAFLKELCSRISQKFPQVLLMAEESTTFPKLTHLETDGGIGFHYKWDMGWMHDTLKYFAKETVYRPWHHHELTFSMSYAFTERFLLALSHDEVVHGKKSILDKMAGDYWQKFAQVRLLYAYMMGHPGAKLSFMGMEIGQFIEWKFYEQLEWFLLKYPVHQKHQDYFKKLNQLYRSIPAFYEQDVDWSGFSWIEPNDNQRCSYTFKRKDKNGNVLYFAFNMTPSPIDEFSIEVEDAGEYELILNSDDPSFGGSGYHLIYNDFDRARFYENRTLKAFSTFLTDNGEWRLYDNDSQQNIEAKYLNKSDKRLKDAIKKQHHIHIRLPGLACLIFVNK